MNKTEVEACELENKDILDEPCHLEQWKQIKDFENYEVSTFGRIRNSKTNKFMKLNNKGGYMNISLSNNIERKSFKVHRLVLIAFVPNPENKTDVNHKDKDKHNNNISNLEWNTRSENNIHGKLNVVITTNKNKSVYKMDKKSDEILDKYDSIQLAADWVVENQLATSSHTARNSIGNVITGLSKSSYGFKWKLENTNETLEDEIWKKVVVDKQENINDNKDSEDKEYFVSSLGRFKNSSRIIMGNNYKVNENGYIRVFIYNKTYALHRLIALTFIPNPNNKLQVNHKDGVKLNNSVSNLEWVTNQENQIHKFKIGLGNNFTRKIGQYDLDMNEIKQFNSIRDASKELNIHVSSIRSNLINITNKSGGFIFKYLD
jgi:hypothetical protein